MSVSTFGHPYETRNVADFESAFLTQVQAVSFLPANPFPTKVIVVDTAVDAGFPNGGTGRSEHGRAMAAIIRNLACGSAPGSGCAAQVATHLALPLRRNGANVIVDRARGGWLGRPSDIASAIHSGLRRALTTPGQGRIIINLSLGWDGAWNGPTLPVAEQMVYAALEEASCQGALIVASAGNAAGAGSDNGPAYPAAWETDPAPTPQRCTALGVPTHGAPPAGYHPLLHAVAAVDGADQRLSHARPNSLTRLVAPGGHVAVSQPSGWSSELYTGTSVSAAAVSAAAAIVWGYAPNLTPDAVMDIVHQAGVDLSAPAQVCLGSGPCTDTAHRVSMCRTLQGACLQSGLCAPPLCASRPAGQDDRAVGIDYSFPAGTAYTYGLGTQFTPGAPCTSSPYATNPPTVENPCPLKTHPSRHVAPFAVPQPPVDPCPNCAVALNSVAIGISDEVSGLLEEPIVFVTYQDGSEKKFVLDNVGGLSGGDTVTVDIEQLNGQDVVKASIEFTYDGAFTAVDDMHIQN